MAQVTALQAYALPGRTRSFAAKGRGTVGPFTELQVYALPGKRHAFTAKGAGVADTTIFRPLIRPRRR